MLDVDATTPQLKALKGLVEALKSGDFKNAEPLLAKDFTFRTLPKSAKLTDLKKEDYLQKMGASFGVFAKIDVRILYWQSPLSWHADVWDSPAHSSRGDRSTRKSRHSRLSLSSLSRHLRS